MSLYRHPDPAIEAWLADGPVALSGSAAGAIKATARLTPQRPRTVMVPVIRRTISRRVLLAAAVLTLLGAGLAALAGMRPETNEILPPDLSPGPSASLGPHVPPPSEPGEGSVIRGAAWSKQLEYDLPAQWDVDVRETREQSGFKRGVAFTLDGPGPYGVRGGSTATPPPDARGIVVAEVTGATAHNPTPVGIGGAGRFLQRLQEVTYFRFNVGPTSETTLAGFPALAADVQGGHLDAVSAMDFGHPSRAIVADVDGGILVVQIWATSTDRLEAWLSEAMAFVSTFRFAATQVATCWSNPATPVSLGAFGRLTLPGTAISIDYTIPDGLVFSAESQPGVIGLAEGGSGLSYDSGPGGPGRGIVIGEAGSAQPHSGGASPTEPFGTDARSIFDRVAAMPQLEVQGGYVLDAPGDMIGPGAIFVVSPDLGALPTHIDRVGATGRDCLVDFLLPNATYFVDLDGEVLILQVWAIDREALSRWLTEANAFIETLRFRVERPAG